jgi:hypothetical protein
MAKKYTADIIEATSITGSLLGTATLASALVPGNKTVEGDLTVTGKITAEEFHTEYVSSSIVYQSGSTKFGDSSDDVMSVTGSLQVQGSITGSLLGTATNAVSSSYAVTSSYAHFAATPTVQGVQGTQGIQGIQGLQGADGYIGVDGAQGIQGIQGLQGVQGTQGIQGVAGDLGGEGTQGTQGIQGLQGRQGTQGIQGTAGSNGAQGTQGIQGTNGSNGAQGIQGIQGTAGSNGAQGTQGIQGTAGSNGSQGTQGIQGTTGTQGIQGVQGIQGSTAGTATYVTVQDTRSTASTPATNNMDQGVRFDFKANSTNGLSDGGTYNGTMYFRPYGSTSDWSGGGAHELGFTVNGDVHHRYGTTSWGSWQRLLDSTNYTGYSNFSGAVYGTVFYDTNNTGYYLNPYGQSIFGSGDQYVLRLEHTATTGDFVDAFYVQNNESGGRVQIGMSANGSDGQHHRVSLRAYKGSGNLEGTFGIALRQASAAHTQRLTLTSPGDLTVDSSMRAPIFYDSNDTGYYLNPAGNSNLYYASFANDVQMNGNYLKFDQSGTRSWSIRASGGNLNFTSGDGSGTYAFTGATSFSANSSWFGGYGGGSGPGLAFENQSTFARIVFWGLDFYDWNNGTQMVINDGYVLANNSMRSPIFYDSNDTTYYFDGTGGTRQSKYLTISGGGSGNYGNELVVGNTSVQYSLEDTNLRPIIQATGAYPVVSINHTVTSNGSHGATLQFTSNGVGNQFVIGSSGNGSRLDIGTSSNTSWNPHNGIDGYNGTTGLRMDTSGNIFNLVSTRSPIYYDNNDTGYYVDAASNSNFNTISVQGGTSNFNGITYFRTNNGGYLGSTDSAKLQAYSDSNNAAFMSFHKGGHYAVNFGLDADNVMRLGGWSASSNRWQLDMSGNMTVAGDVTAYSDRRVKENIVTVDNALEKVNNLRGVYYNRTDSEDKKTKLGVIAQEILEVVPEVVGQDNDGMYNVSYGNLAGLFIEAIKEQQTQIENQQSQIDELKALVKTLVG